MRTSRSCATHSDIAFARMIYASRTGALTHSTRSGSLFRARLRWTHGCTPWSTPTLRLTGHARGWPSCSVARRYFGELLCTVPLLSRLQNRSSTDLARVCVRLCTSVNLWRSSGMSSRLRRRFSVTPGLRASWLRTELLPKVRDISIVAGTSPNFTPTQENSSSVPSREFTTLSTA